MRKHTWGLCNQCFGIVPAVAAVNHGEGVSITKKCPVHGTQKEISDPSVDFYLWHNALPKANLSKRASMTSISVTTRCNLKCPGCCYLPDKAQDIPAEEVVRIAKKTTSDFISLMGAEPTMRDDLPELIAAVKKETGRKAVIHTNGIRCGDDPAYVQRLAGAGLDRVNMSLHFPSYVGKRAFEAKLRALENLRKAAVPIDHVDISLKSLKDMEEAIETILNLDMTMFSGDHVRIRAPSPIGGGKTIPCHMSELVARFLEVCAAKGLPVKALPYTHHMYAIFLEMAGRNVLLVRWPTEKDIDLVEANIAPMKGLFSEEVGETQALHQIILVNRMRDNKMMPPAPFPQCPSIYCGREQVGMRIEEIRPQDLIKQGMSLFDENRTELVSHKDIMPLNPDFAKYTKLEANGVLDILALYDGPKVVGYSILISTNTMHHKDLHYSESDVIFVSEKYRNGRWGLKLIDETKKLAARRGAEVVAWKAKPGTTLEKILRKRKKCTVEDLVFIEEM